MKFPLMYDLGVHFPEVPCERSILPFSSGSIGTPTWPEAFALDDLLKEGR